MSAEQSTISRGAMPPTEPVERTRVFQNEWATRYGVLMGGTAVVETPGIGQFWIGHSQIFRREWAGFTHQQVRGRNEAQDGQYLDDPGGALLGASPLESSRLEDKSPALCMREAIQMLGAKGFINSQALMGYSEANVDRIFNVVLPSNIAVLPIVDVIKFLEDSTYIGKSFLADPLKVRAEIFREEALQGAYISQAYMVNYTNAVSEEIGSDKKTGKKKVDSVDIEYFWELKLTLPKDKPLEATTMLGREIAGAMSKGNDSSALVAAMERQNELKAEENELRRRELDLMQSPSAEDSTTPKRADGETDRRFKANKE